MFVMGAGARGLQVENEPVQGTVNKMDWGQVGGGGGQAHNQDFPKGCAKKGVIVWAREHRVKGSERGGRGCRWRGGGAELPALKIFRILV